ncbi:MAG: hypothetical protein ACKVOP_09470 [Sphingomonadaceae bacterium]
MRPVIAIVLVAVAALIAAFAFGVVDIDQTREGALPEIRADGGNLPEFDVKTADVDITTTNTTIDVPTVETRKETVQLPNVEVGQAK